MRNIILGMSAVVLASVSMPAMADEAAAPSELTINGSATVVSDYRFRGISQTDKRFAVQGSLTVTHASGFYASVWGSSIDEYVAAASDQEIDIIGGYSKAFGPATIDVGVLYYYYPGSSAIISANTDFFEPYASVKGTFGPVTAKLSAAYAPKQHAIAGLHSRDDNFYGAIDLSGAVPSTPISLSAHLGHNFMDDSFLSGGKKYTDWSVGASYAYKSLTFGVSYVDTNFPKGALATPFTGRDAGKGGVVGSVGVSF
ncbi:MAG: TorF family putative porin [Sphingobium sp.]